MVVHLVGDERHERVQKLQKPDQHVVEYRPGHRRALLVIEAGLCHLDVPVAELAPREVIDLLRRKAQVVGVEARGHAADGLVELGEDPAVGRFQEPIVDGGEQRGRFPA